MSIIIDANRSGDFSLPATYHAPEILRRVRDKKLRVAVGGRLLKELMNTKLRDLIVEWNRSGRLRRIDDEIVDQEELAVNHMNISSDDSHILALARVSNERFLYTQDGNLINDFTNVRILRPKGKIVTPTTPNAAACSLFDRFGE